jgi:hypothetical protein
MMLAAGLECIGAVQHSGGMSWQHFCCPDCTVLEITSVWLRIADRHLRHPSLLDEERQPAE